MGGVTSGRTYPGTVTTPLSSSIRRARTTPWFRERGLTTRDEKLTRLLARLRGTSLEARDILPRERGQVCQHPRAIDRLTGQVVATRLMGGSEQHDAELEMRHVLER